ncbi:MAG: FAD-binding oxidoreductase [Euryarchaeota archaeon]|nr:FAD-binding oxidoreductase [Euryarchaeota archaeon]
MAAYVDELRAALGERVRTEDFERFAYGADWSPRTPKEVFPPDVVILPRETEDVRKAVEIALRHGVPVTAGGGLTGMAGGAVPIHGGIYIDATSMNRIIEVDAANQTVRAQGGATMQEILDALEPHGLWIPNLPESKWSCTVASEIACDNDSTFGMRWGKILNALLSVEVVTGRAEVVEFGHRKAHFSSSGYKVKDLFAGSEGTLGVITAATLKAEPVADGRSVDMILFPSMTRAVGYLDRLLKAGLAIDGAHINCKRRLRFYTHAYKEKHGHEPEVPDWAEALLAIILSGDRKVLDFNKKYAFKIASEMGGQPVKERDIVESWWISKHTLAFEPYKQKWPKSQTDKKFGACDPGVPMGRLEEFYRAFVATAEKHQLQILGMNAYLEHPNSIGFSCSCALFVNYRDQGEVDRFRRYFEELSRIAVDMGGTMSTYMGDTDLRVPYLEYEHGSAVAYFRELKKVFDPKGIMNPGKKLRWEGEGKCGAGAAGAGSVGGGAPAPGGDGAAGGGGR